MFNFGTFPKIKKIKALKDFNVDYLILPKIKDPVEASMQKLKIYEAGKAAARITVARLSDSSVAYVVDSAAFERFSKPLIEYRERRFITQDEKEKIAEAKLSFPMEN